MELTEILKHSKILPVIRTSSQKEAVNVVEALLEGGINVIEITMSIPGAIELIRTLNMKYKDEDVIIGAGTLIDSINTSNAIYAGSKFIVSPILDEDMIGICNKYNIPIIPGVLTPSEMIRATKLGASAVKIFPADSLGGPKYLKNVLGPLPHLKIIPTGGVTLNTIKDYLEAGAIAVGVGSSLIDKKALKDKNYKYITQLAEEFLKRIV